MRWFRQDRGWRRRGSSGQGVVGVAPLAAGLAAQAPDRSEDRQVAGEAIGSRGGEGKGRSVHPRVGVSGIYRVEIAIGHVGTPIVGE